VKKTLEHVNQTVWELKKKIAENPENYEYKRNLLQFFHESAAFTEKQNGVPDSDRSFLLLRERESVTCFLIHGAGGSPNEMRQLAERLYSEGYTVYGVSTPLRPAPSRSESRRALFNRSRREDPAAANVNGTRFMSTWSECLSTVRIALETVLSCSESTYLFGFSFGGTIALDLLLDYPVRGAVLLSPALYPVRTLRYLAFLSVRKIAPSAARTLAPREYTIIEFMEMTRERLHPIDKPVLVIQARNDPVVSPRGFSMLEKTPFGSDSRFVMLDSSRHVLVDGAELEKISSLSTEFIRGF
jgi:esterase/lipase